VTVRLTAQFLCQPGLDHPCFEFEECWVEPSRRQSVQQALFVRLPGSYVV
jgi:hypothetical protein